MLLKKEFALSFLIHTTLLMVIIILGGYPGKIANKPVVVFLSSEPPGGSGGRGVGHIGFQLKESEQVPAVTTSATKINTPAVRTKRSPQRIADKTRDERDVPVATRTLMPETASVSPATTDGHPSGTVREGGGSGGPGRGGFGSGPGGQGGSGGGSGKGHGTGSGDGNILFERYLAEHYAYIRNLIMRRLKYPPIARKMGWRGKVVVSFLIKESGHVENTRIISSSGYEVLDRNVLSTIREAQPFPRPPVMAELIIPIAYRLESQ